MGRGNIRTFGECEGLWYVDQDLIDCFRKILPYDQEYRFQPFDLSEESKTARELSDSKIEYTYDRNENSDCEWRYDSCDTALAWTDGVELVCESICKRFKSFSREDKWLYREQHVILENKFFQIAVEDNEWSMAFILLERGDVEITGADHTRMRRDYTKYLDGLKEVLLDVWGECSAYGGAWTHGEVFRRDEATTI